MTAKIQYCSDLHLEFPINKDYLKQRPLKPLAETLVLAGDIVPFSLIEKHKDFFKYASDHFKCTFWLPGNHEYYHFDIAEKSASFHEAISNNVFLVNNISLVHDNIKMIFSTLWSHIKLANQWQIENSLNDFRLIKFKGSRFSVEQYNQLYAESFAFIEKELKKVQVEKVAVFSHHCPSFLNYPEEYKGDVLNEAFAVELHDFIASSKIDYWVYGHHHRNTPEFKIGNTKLITNQLGYVQIDEHKFFQSNKFFEL